MKKYFHLIWGLFLLLLANANAQVFNGDLVFNTQAQIDFFGLTNYTSISGNLIIDSGNSPGTGDITNLDSLHRLTSVGKELHIFNNANLTSISGLSNLTSVGALASFPAEGTLSIVLNNSLTNIDGLSNLMYIGGPLYIYDNDILENIDGLQSLQNFDAFFQISGNLALTDIDGLTNSLNGISGGFAIGGFSIFNNPSLTSIAGLTNIISTYGNIEISNNPLLPNLNGLSNLQFIHGSLEISENSLITNLNELSNLELVTGTPFAGLTITDNPALINFDGLNTLASNCGLKKDYDISGNGSNPPASLLERFDACLANNPAIANAGTDQTVVASATVQLDGSASSDIDGDPISYRWSMINLPAGSNAALSDNSVVNPTFVADLTGDYTIQLIVNDSYVDSNPDQITITAQSVPDATQDVIDVVQTLPLNDGNKNALLSKLNNALKKYNEGNYTAAANILNAFINQLNQFVADGSITLAEAQPLIDYANQIIAAINLSLPKAENNSGTQLPEEFALHQNYPNPFNPSTMIRFSLPVQTQVKISIYNMLGELVKTVSEGIYEAGHYNVSFDASELSSGTYIYRIESNDFVETKKMLLLK